MVLSVLYVDYAPAELKDQLPLRLTLLRKMPGNDRDDYWLAQVDPPIRWAEKESQPIHHVIVAPRFVGEALKSGVGRITLGLAYVVDETLLDDAVMDFQKCFYAAICLAQEIQ